MSTVASKSCLRPRNLNTHVTLIFVDADTPPSDTTAGNTSPRAIFIQEGELFVPTHLAQGPWYEDSLHGGAIVGLAAYAAEMAPCAAPMRPTRITTELFRRVPMAPVRTKVKPVRDGKRIQQLQVSIFGRGSGSGRDSSSGRGSGSGHDSDSERDSGFPHDSVELARANVMRVREDPEAVSEDLLPGEDSYAPVPEFLGEEYEVDTSTLASPTEKGQPAYPSAFSLRSRRKPRTPRAVIWWKMHSQLVAGVPLTPFVRTAATVDFLQSAGGLLGAGKYVSINPDLTIYLHRLSDDPWIAIENEVHFTRDGIGVTNAKLYDRKSAVGSASKSLLIYKR